jgi:Ca-activated chloride channel homolog
MRRLFFVLLVMIVLVAVALVGFGNSDPTTLASSSVRVTQVDTGNYPEITLYVAATDDAARPLAGLAAADFSVSEDGAPVGIETFTGGGAASISTVLVIDRSGSMEEDNKMAGARAAAGAFVEQMRPGDSSALLAFSSNVRVLQDFTVNQGALSNAIAGIDAGGGTALYDSIAAGVDLLAEQHGRRVLLVLTDGKDESSRFNVQDAIAAANRHAQPVYLVGLGETGFFGSINEPVLERIADETGGAYFYAPHADELAQLYADLAGGLQAEYSLTYTSPRPFNDGTRRDIQVTLGGQTAAGAYTEQHLIKVASSPLIGVALLVPLLGLLLLPDLARRRGWKRLNEQPAPAEPLPPEPGTPEALPDPAEPVASSSKPHCDNCGAGLRPGARFCTGCGAGRFAAVPTAPPSIYCDQCGRPLRSGARFCNNCGANAPLPPQQT